MWRHLGNPTESRLAGKFSFTPEPVNRLVFLFPFLSQLSFRLSFLSCLLFLFLVFETDPRGFLLFCPAVTGAAGHPGHA